MSEIKSGEKLYHYCQVNLHTKSWIQSLKNERIRNINNWIESCSPIGRNEYYLEKIEKNYLSPVDELAFLLESKCAEHVIFDTVYYAANQIFKDIARELNEMFYECSYNAVFCANKRKETAFFFGSQSLAQDLLFSEEGIFMKLGYDVLVDFMDRSKYSTLSELSNYLESKGFNLFA